LTIVMLLMSKPYMWDCFGPQSITHYAIGAPSPEAPSLWLKPQVLNFGQTLKPKL